MFYLNGAFVEEADAKISVLDLGLTRSYGVFDALRSYGGRPFHLYDHLLRLQYSADQIGLVMPYSFQEIEDAMYTLLQKNHLLDASIKIMLTGGVSKDQITPEGNTSLIIMTLPLAPKKAEDYTQGIRASTTSLVRSIPQAKTLHYVPAIIALREGKAFTAKEALYLNPHQEILEGTTSNFFALTKQGELFTNHSDEVLLGITREVVLQLAKPLCSIQKRSIHYAEVNQLAEAFITSSVKEIVPVVSIDDQPIHEGKVGPFTQKIMELFRAYTEQKEWLPLHIPRYTK